MKSLKRQEKGLLLNRTHRAGAGEAFPAFIPEQGQSAGECVPAAAAEDRSGGAAVPCLRVTSHGRQPSVSRMLLARGSAPVL